MLGSPSLSPRKPIHKMAKAARWISLEKHGGESPMSSCQNCATAGSMAVERSCRSFHANESLGQSRYRRALFFSYLSRGKRAEAKPCKYINECTNKSNGIGQEHFFKWW